MRQILYTQNFIDKAFCAEVYCWRSWHQQIIALLADLQPNAASLWNHLGSHCRWSTAESIMGMVTLGANRCCTRSIATTWKLIPLPLIRNSLKKKGAFADGLAENGPWPFLHCLPGKTHVLLQPIFSHIFGPTLSSPNFSGSPRQMRRKWGAALSGCEVLVHMLPDGLFADSRFLLLILQNIRFLLDFQKNKKTPRRGVVVHLPVVARSLKGLKTRGLSVFPWCGQTVKPACQVWLGLQAQPATSPWTQGADERDGGHEPRGTGSEVSPEKREAKAFLGDGESWRVEELKSWSRPSSQIYSMAV